jgi:DNA-binding NtrC family response regulator
MSSRSVAAALARLLNNVSSPVCVFDEERRLVFANEACTRWSGVALEELVGQLGSYSAVASEHQSPAVNWLCPPPEVFAGRREPGRIYAVSPAGDVLSCEADFVPLEPACDDGAGPVLVIGMLSDAPEDRSSTTVDRVAADPARILHEQLIHFHNQQRSRYRLDRLVGQSPAMALVRAQVETAIACRVGTTIVGPAGSQRELVARMIHYGRDRLAVSEQTDRHARPCVPMDGSLLTADLLSATANTVAAYARGTGTVVLLSHLDQLPIELQPDLLRQIVQRKDVTLLATSTEPPSSLVAQGRIQPQLYTAVGAIIISLPALAQRREDVPLLAQSLIEELNLQGAKQLRGCTAEAIDALVAHAWPGDVAELRQVIVEASASASGVEITPDDLPRRIFHAAEAVRRPAPHAESIVLAEFLTDIERELIGRALKQAKGNKARAAKLLGLTRPRLYRRMVQLGLEQVAAAVPHSEQRPRPPKRRRPAKRPLETIAEPPLADEMDNDDEIEFIPDIPFEEQID